jgi:peptide deformylase
MILKVLNYKNPVVREKSEKIKEITPEIKRLALDMLETMQKEKGLGLAAPQVGELKRIIAVYLIENRSATARDKLIPKILINPKIIKRSKETETEEEGCLCAPGLFLPVKRAKTIEATALDIEGNKLEIKAEGLPARILQHETDHLDGILFLDRISFWQKAKLRNILKNDNQK